MIDSPTLAPSQRGPRRGKPRLRLIKKEAPPVSRLSDVQMVDAVPEISFRYGGLFSTISLPIFEVSVSQEPSVFYRLPEILSRLREDILFGAAEYISERIDSSPDELESLFYSVNNRNFGALKRLRLLYGLTWGDENGARRRYK